MDMEFIAEINEAAERVVLEKFGLDITKVAPVSEERFGETGTLLRSWQHDGWVIDVVGEGDRSPIGIIYSKDTSTPNHDLDRFRENPKSVTAVIHEILVYAPSFIDEMSYNPRGV